MSAAVHAEDHQGDDDAPAEVTAAKYAKMHQAAVMFAAELEYLAGQRPSSKHLYARAKTWSEIIEHIDSNEGSSPKN